MGSHQSGRVCAGCFAAFLFSAALSAQIPIFVPQPEVTVGTGPVSLSVGKFTATGSSDVVTANEGAASLTVLRGLGNGFFQNLTKENVGISPSAVAAGDFNADGRLDLVVTNFAGNSISVLLGTGVGTFVAAPSLSATGPLAVVVADFNGDGRPDLAVAEGTSNTIAIFLGLGGGAFRLLTRLYVGSRPAFIVAADFNGDGKQDLAVANYASNNVSILLGIGNGFFVGPLNFDAGPSPSCLAVGDFNGDGRADLAVANATGFSTSTVSVLLGLGGGIFLPPLTSSVGANATFLAAGDFNLDGKLDLAVANTASNTVSILLGIGNGRFLEPLNIAVGSRPAWISVADLNGDGKPDLLVANSQSNTVSVLINRTAAPATVTSVVNAGGMTAGPVAPGEIVTIFGSSLVAGAATSTQVLFNGIPAPLIVAGPSQINAIVPYGVAGHANTQLIVQSDGQASASMTLPVAASAPGLFTASAAGTGQAAALNQDGSVNSASHPAAKGSVVALYATGAGQTNPPGVDGALATGNLPAPLLPILVTVGGQPARVLYAGAAPGFIAGLLQVNVQLPEVPSGSVPVALQIGSAVSQPGVTLTLQ